VGVPSKYIVFWDDVVQYSKHLLKYRWSLPPVYQTRRLHSPERHLSIHSRANMKAHIDSAYLTHKSDVL